MKIKEGCDYAVYDKEQEVLVAQGRAIFINRRIFTVGGFYVITDDHDNAFEDIVRIEQVVLPPRRGYVFPNGVAC